MRIVTLVPSAPSSVVTSPAYDAARGALADAVHTARRQPSPASWQTIADVVGITRQSAHERWS